MQNPLIVDSDPQWLLVENARSTEFKLFSGHEVSDIDRRFSHAKFHTLGGIYDELGNLVPLSVRSGGHGGDHVTSIDPPSLLSGLNSDIGYERFAGRTAYIGTLMNHYGHFITESLSRLWFAEHSGAFDHYVASPFIFNNGRSEITDFHRYFLAILGIDITCVCIIKKASAFDSIFVPEQLFTVNKACNANMRRVYKKIIDLHIAKNSSARIFLSRSTDISARIANAKDVEELFRSQGFSIIYPEQLEIKAQLDLYANCKILAGLSGSALHNSVFASPETLIIEVGDCRARTRSLPMQEICNAVSQCRSVHIPYVGTADGVVDIRRLAENLAAALSEPLGRGDSEKPAPEISAPLGAESLPNPDQYSPAALRELVARQAEVHAEELTHIKARHRTELERLDRRHADEVGSLRLQHEAELEQLRRERSIWGRLIARGRRRA